MNYMIRFNREYLYIIIQILISQINNHFRALSLLHCKTSEDCMVLPWLEGLRSQRFRRIRASSEVLILSQSAIFIRTLKQIMN